MKWRKDGLFYRDIFLAISITNSVSISVCEKVSCKSRKPDSREQKNDKQLIYQPKQQRTKIFASQHDREMLEVVSDSSDVCIDRVCVNYL